MKRAVLRDRINQMEIYNDPAGSLVLRGGARAHTERPEQRGRRIWELESRTRRQLIEGKAIQRLRKQLM